MRSVAAVADVTLRRFSQVHLRIKIRQVEPPSSRRDGQRAGCVQTEKPDSWLSSDAHIGPHIQFRERHSPGDWNESAQSNARHSKGNNPYPCASVMGFNFDAVGNQRTKRAWLNRPV